ncbi:MAG: DNA mismatch repair endonuclease MutL [Planctomycetes bacterium]|nr:DNA mismatch repair endonuclease MutL [Planctomycetota bacterium]
MAGIHILPAELVNKIAAGEVIERPASVVKELIENSLDAGATFIEITIEDGGRKSISVRDNGIGMDADDLSKAFMPHATSKIAKSEDLFNIQTMGFRGEALASIAAVGRIDAISKPRDSKEPHGFSIHIEGGNYQPVKPASMPGHGTVITVQDLFYNTPARRKFLRTANTEFGHILEQFYRLTIPNCQVEFTLIHNKKPILHLPANQSLRARLSDLFGSELADNLIDLTSKEDEIIVSGLICPPHQARTSSKWQYFFVNRRFVRDKILTHALKEAYRGLAEPTRHPAAIIFLEIDPADIDVNVHPTKIEVRFRNAQKVHSQLFGALRDVLNKTASAPSIRIATTEQRSDAQIENRRESLKEALAEFFKSSRPSQPQLQRKIPQGKTIGKPYASDKTENHHGRESQASATISKTDSLANTIKQSPQYAPIDLQSIPSQKAQSEKPSPRLGLPAIQIHNSYIVVETETGLAIIDQHALHERILFEEISQRLSAGNLLSQRLLIPEIVEVSQTDKIVLAGYQDLFDRLGLEVSEFGPTSIAIHSVPVLMAERKVSPVQFLRDVIGILADAPSIDQTELLERIIATMACKAAIKSGEPLSPAEIEALLSKADEIDRSSSCPHGRPTTITVTLEELEKQFKRT